MNVPYTLFNVIADEVETPADGTLSRTVYHDDALKVVLFGFSSGQELSEHTSTRPAIMHFLSGEAEVTLGPDLVTARSGTWIHMPPELPHSIRTKTPVAMLLLLLKAPDVPSG
jgi:quercetin dioxygenase-like cupin family protein